MLDSGIRLRIGRGIWLVFFFTLSGCQLPSLNTSTSSGFASSSTTSMSFGYRAALQPTIPYLNANYQLPTLPSSLPGTVSWSSDTFTIEDGVLLYPSPFENLNIQVTANVSIDNQTLVYDYDLLVKHQLDVPSVREKPELFLQLQDNKLESEIQATDYLRGQAMVKENRNGAYQTYEIPSDFGIRLRGHSTSFNPKRPYRLRFDENTSLFGMKSAKNYILLANYFDGSLVRNSIVTWMSKFYQQTMYTLDYRFVELTINEEYLGQYLLMERVEFSRNRLDVQHRFDQDDAGFMLELDMRAIEENRPFFNLEWFTIQGVPYVIKEPNPITNPFYEPRHTTYIAEYLETTRQVLISQSGFESKIDVDNWLDYFLIQEITKNVDVGYGSVYLVKTPGGKLKHMPLWDFDLALGNAAYPDIDVMANPEGHWGWATYEKNSFFTLMMKIPALRNQFREKLIAFRDTVLPRVLFWLADNEPAMMVLSEANYGRWGMNECLGPWCPTPPAVLQLTTIAEQFEYLAQFLTTRVDWMIDHI